MFIMTFCLFRKNHLAMKYIQNGNQFHLLECYLNKHQNLTHLNDKIGKCKFYLQLEKKSNSPWKENEILFNQWNHRFSSSLNYWISTKRICRCIIRSFYLFCTIHIEMKDNLLYLWFNINLILFFICSLYQSTLFFYF